MILISNLQSKSFFEEKKDFIYELQKPASELLQYFEMGIKMFSF